jgi:hypothetical protein
MLRRAALGLPLDAEDPGHDHVERDRLHVRGQGKGAADRPAVDLALGGVGDHLRVLLDRLAVEGRQQQFALAHVARADRGEDRVGADDAAAAANSPGQRRRLLGLGVNSEPHVSGGGW